MLSEDEKVHIREEEVLRSEIRKQLDGTELIGSKSSAIWKFINSAFFLWFASSVILASASFLYGHWEKQRVVEQERNLTARKLDAEIASRLRYFSAFYQLGNREGARANDLRLKALLSLEKPSEAEYPVNAFPEYANRSFRSLLWELTRVVPENEKKGLNTADSAATKLSSIYVSWRTVGESPACNLDTKSQSEAQFQRLLHVIETYNRVAADTLTIQSLNLDRWGRPLDLNLTLDSTSPKEQIQVIGH